MMGWGDLLLAAGACGDLVVKGWGDLVVVAAGCLGDPCM